MAKKETSNTTPTEAPTEAPTVPKEPKDIFGDYARPTLTEGKTINLYNQKELGLQGKDFEDYGAIHVGEDIGKLREKNQSGWEQAGSFGTQLVGEVIGGAISGIGATIDIPDAILSEINDKDADFKNIITEAGDAISEWSKEAAPIYRKNPDKSFDLTDSGWWLENGVSIASTLSLLIPAVGTVKGIGYVGKMLGLADELAVATNITRAGRSLGIVEEGFGASRQAINTTARFLEKSKYFGKIATSAVVSRNAENFKESSQVLQDTKDNLLGEWEKNPDAYNKLLESDVAKELADEGREVNQENLANFISSKAAWLSYGVNSINVVFDAIQMAPLFKGFKPNVSLGGSLTGLSVRTAQAEALGQSLTRFDKIASYMNPFVSNFARYGSEGIEEAINYVGGKEGRNYADQLAGKETKDLGSRIGDYLVDPKMYESAVWGVIGGVTFGGAVAGLNKLSGIIKGKDGTSLREARVQEINNRIGEITRASEQIKSIQNDESLTDVEKEKHIGDIKAQITTSLAIKAAQVGNFNMLVEHLSSPELKNQMLKSGYATEEDVDKAVANSLVDAQTALDIYNSNYNLFQTKPIDENIKSIQIAERTYWESISRKQIERKNQISKEIEQLKSNDNYINSTSDLNVNSTIELEALTIAKNSVESLTSSSQLDRNAPALTQYQSNILETVNKRISTLKENLKEKANLSTLNPSIIEKQAELELKNMYVQALAHKLNFLSTNQYSEIIRKDNEKTRKDIRESESSNFSTFIENKSKDELLVLREENKKNKEKFSIIDKKIKELEKVEDIERRKSQVQSSRDKAEKGFGNADFDKQQVSNLEEKLFEDTNKDQTQIEERKQIEEVSPVENVPVLPNDLIFDVFDEDFKEHNIDESELKVDTKNIIDNAISSEDYGGLLNLNNKLKNTSEQKYLQNKITERKKQLIEELAGIQQEVILNEVPVSIIEDFINEENLALIENKSSTEINKKDENGLLFSKLVSSNEDNKDSIKPWLDILNLLDFDNRERISKDENENLIINKENDEAISELYSLQGNDEIILKIDTSNSTYNSSRNDQNEVPIGLYRNNKRIGYLARSSRFSGNSFELQHLKSIRESLGIDPKKQLKTLVTEKTNGDVINTKEFYPVKDLSIENYEFYTVLNTSAGHQLERLSLEKAYHTNEKKPYGRIIDTAQGKRNLQGVVYLMLHNVNGQPFPTPLSVSKLSNDDSSIVENSIKQLLNLLDSGKSLNSQEIITLKDKISEYIYVDDSRDIKREQDSLDKKRAEYLKYENSEIEESKAIYEKLKAEYLDLQNKRNLNFRVYPKTKSGKGARVEFTYIAGDKGKRKILLSNSEINIYNAKTGEFLYKKYGTNGEFGKVFSDQGDSTVLNKILQHKYYNIDFKRLKAGNESYKKSLIDKSILKTNVGEIRTSNGKSLSNFTNFNIRLSSKTSEVTTEVDSKIDLGKPEISKVEDGDLYEFKTKQGLVAGVLISPNEFRLDGITVYEVGKGNGTKLFEELISFLKEKNVTIISTNSAGEGAVKMHEKAVTNGLLKEISKDGRNGRFEIVNQSKKDNIKNVTEVNIGDRISDINGKLGTVISIEDNKITMKMDNGAIFSANPKVIELFIEKRNNNENPNQKLFDNLFDVRKENNLYKDNFFDESKENYSLFRNKKTTSSEILNEIINDPSSKIILDSAKALLNNRNNIEISFKEISNNNESGNYNTLENKIYINNKFNFKSKLQFQETVLHEIVHAATILPIIKYQKVLINGKSPDFTKFEFDSNTPKHIVDFVNKMEELRKESSNIINKRFPYTTLTTIEQTYGLTNVYEFISEIFINKTFREAIKQDRNLLERLLDSISEFLYKVLGINITNNNIDLSLREITKFISNEELSYEKLLDGMIPILNSDYAEFRKITDTKLISIFSSEEKNHLINFTNNATLQYFKKSGELEEIGNNNIKEITTSKDFVKSKIKLVLDNAIINDSQKELLNRAIDNFDLLWPETIKQTNRIFGVQIDNDFDSSLDINETLEIQKNWDDNVANSTSMNDQLSKEVKWFIATTPLKDNEGNTVQNVVTGLPESVNYSSVINLMIKHLSTAQTEYDLLNKLKILKIINPSFELMADRLSKDVNLLAAFKSQFTRNLLDSNVLLISKVEDYIKVKVENEFKKTKGYINIADNWNKTINNNIENKVYSSSIFLDLLKDIRKEKLQFEKFRLEENLSNNGELTEKGSNLSSLMFRYSNLLGIELSIPAIEDNILSSRNLDDVSILKRLDQITISLLDGEKNNNNQNLNEIAKFQDKYDVQFAEVMALNLKGEPVYSAQLPSFLTNFFSKLKSDNKETRENFEREFFEIVKNDPVMQFSNWAWTEKDSLGLFNYEVLNGKKSPTSINKEFLSMWNLAKLGGAKNTISKDVQDYTEFTDNTYKTVLGFMYLEQKESKSQNGNKYVWIPSLIPSDSGNLVMIKVNRFSLENGDLTFTKENNKIKDLSISENSKIFKAIQNITFQEIERMKQAYDLVFDVTENSINLKSQYYNENTNSLTDEGIKWFSQLEKNYHYENIIYKKDSNEVDLKATLFNKNGNPSGRVFIFHNLKINGKTLNDFAEFKKPYNLVGTLSKEFISKNINSFIQSYISSLVRSEIEEYSNIQNEGIFKQEIHAFIGDGSFEQFVAEMTLNNYIHNSEQQVWFNGVTAEYKNNVDTNKRAKQMSAPGNAPSTSGNQEYTAVTIRDVKLASKTLKTIKLQVSRKLLEEKNYKYKNNKELLEADTESIIEDYFKINSGDAQGYITLKGLKELYTKYGMMNDTMKKVFFQIESGEQLTTESIKTLQSIKPFSYGRNYNFSLNKMSSNQIKLSYLPLIPQLIKGTQLEKLAEVMDKKSITRAFFESAHKIGATQIYKVADDNGNIVDEWLNSVEPQSYKYSDEQIQLTVPDHLVDSTNLLATQIAKLIVANLSNEKIYNLHDKLYTGDEIKNYYFDLLTKNIEESKDNLLSDIKVSKNEDGKYVFEDINSLRDLLLEEIASRGLGKNYEDAIQLKEDGTFVLPLFTGKNSDKWESILTSIFTNRIMKQKLPGASLTLASDLFTKSIIQEEYQEDKIKGIEWHKDKTDRELYSYKESLDGKEINVVEVLMGSWSSKFFKDGNRTSINSISDDVRTMVGYRIPTQAKHSMVVFKVVGFLPEESKGSIIMPNDIITQMGSDFDIDKLFIMYKNIAVNENGEFTTDIKEASYKQIKQLEKKLKQLEESKKLDEETTKLINDIFSNYDEDFIEIESNYDTAKNKLEYLIKKVERKDRENEIIELYKSILINPYHLKESFTPATFEDFIKGKKILDDLFKTSDENIDILSPAGQRTFRKRNMVGRVLKGIAANFNSFLPVAQNTGMYLSKELAYNTKVRISGFPINEYEKVYDLNRLKEKYTDIKVNGNYATIYLKNLGRSDNGDYQNIDDNIITEVASQGIGAAVDIVKDPTFDAFNATTYTYPQFNLGLAVGMNPMYMMFFTRQPILKILNDDYFNNKSLLSDDTGKDRQKVRDLYENLLFNSLIKKGIIKEKPINLINKNYKSFNKEERKEFFNYDLDTLGEFSDGELYELLRKNKVGRKELSLDEEISYYRDQLLILNQFNKYKEAADASQDVLRAVKTDAHGAGPELNKTTDLSDLILKSYKSKKVLIKGKPAVSLIYPKLFGKKEDSLYPVVESYFNNVNELSYDILSPLFITQNPNYIKFKKDLKWLGIFINKNNEKTIKRFFNKSILQDLNLFSDYHKDRVLGTSKYKENKSEFDGTIESFQNLSTQDKLIVIKEITSSEIVKEQFSILNRLIPNDNYSELGYSKIEFNTNYKDTMLDDTFAEQLEVIYNSGNEFKKEFIKDLLRYNYFVNGMEFGFGSISKVFPPNVLVKEGIGEHLYNKNIQEVIDMNFDYFYRNNSQNGEIVPKTRTKYLKKNGERVPLTDSFGNEIEDNGKPVYLTDNNTPVWDSNSSILQISSGKLKNEPANIRNSPYITLSRRNEVEEKTVFIPSLYKKYQQDIKVSDTSLYEYVDLTIDNITETYKVEKVSYKDNLYLIEFSNKKKNDSENSILNIEVHEDGIIDQFSYVTPLPKFEWYYQVNPLGKDNIIELSDKSSWIENNLVNEEKNLQDLENRMLNINKNSIGFENISQEDINNHKKNCQ